MLNTVESRLTVRRMTFGFEREIDRHWCGGDPVRTHVFNAMTLIFPRLEQGLIRAAKASLAIPLGKTLETDLRAFVQQEAQHKAQHLRFFENLRQSGYAIDRYLKLVDRVMDFVEARCDLVALGAAGEHFTATGSEHILRSELLSGADPEMKALFEWHFAEEIEHKSVLFDVMVERSIGTITKWKAWLWAYSTMFVLLNLGVFMLLYEDGSLRKMGTWKALASQYFGRTSVIRSALAAAPKFLARGFHPNDIDNLHLATAVFASSTSRRGT
jgi:predicted metal-dependent hydrolase